MKIYIIIPIILFLSGLTTLIISTKKINNFIGYRTKNSMKNEKNWKFANEKSGILLMRFGILSFLFGTIFLSLKEINSFIYSDNIFVLINIILIFATIFVTESDLKKQF